MTWLKLSDDFDDDCARVDLSDAAFRTHIQGLIYTMRRETDGWLDDRAARKIPDTPDGPASIAELCDVGFWRRFDGGYRIVHQMEWQPTASDLAARREADAARQAKARTKRATEARKKAATDQESRRDTERESQSDDPHDYGSGRVGSGQVPLQTNPPRQEEKSWTRQTSMQEPEGWR